MISLVIIDHPNEAEPAVAVGRTMEEAQRKAVGLLQVWHEIGGSIADDDPTFLDTHPWPNRRDSGAVARWLTDLQQATTIPRIIFLLIG